MGAKQSKRSVDISGKEAEGAGEVAAAGAGGEGRVEPLADADALKPQLNGDAHIHEQTDKEKQLDSGTPENEKDATTEKEGKEESEEKEVITNGDNSEQKTENGESTPTPEESKKPKKEKVKKKWSLRSISFSRKDKPKQEKKQKEEEPKVNGDAEKVPEEAAEVTAETVKNEETEVKVDAEIKEEKTPETPVTEPITNGSNTPESPKEEVVAKEVVPVTNVESDKPETKKEMEPEQLPINGLSIEEPLKEEPEETVKEVAKVEENKSEESPAETTETVPAVEIPVQNEVCVEQMPLIESTPPPLPANPPPSSVASFAATTMAPVLTDASLANTTQTAISTPPTDTKAELPKECLSESSHTVLTSNESDIHVPSSPITSQEEVNATSDSVVENIETTVSVEREADSEVKKDELDIKQVEENIKMEVELNGSESEILNTPVLPESPTLPETLDSETSDTTGDLPPPPPPEDDDDTLNDDVTIEKIEPPTMDELQEANNAIDANISNGEVAVSNGIDKEETVNGNLETQLKAVNADVLKNTAVECNGNTLEECEAEESSARAPSPPASQEPIAVSDKMADLIPEVPVVPDLNTETLQETSDAVVAN